jgi:geranylgeranyl pyrophosphate synthase
MDGFAAELRRLVERIETGLGTGTCRPPTTRPARLHAAMRYSLEAGGKRLRPVLVLASAELFRRLSHERRGRPTLCRPPSPSSACTPTR